MVALLPHYVGCVICSPPLILNARINTFLSFTQEFILEDAFIYNNTKKLIQFIKIKLMFQYLAIREEIEKRNSKINSSNGNTVLKAI
jgi:hypothetical protein